MKLRAWLAVTYWVAVLAMMAAAMTLARWNGTGTSEDIFYILGLMGFATVGALIVVQRPNNLIGWIFCADGLSLPGRHRHLRSTVFRGHVTYAR
jgi:hypothetical protein